MYVVILAYLDAQRWLFFMQNVVPVKSQASRLYRRVSNYVARGTNEKWISPKIYRMFISLGWNYIKSGKNLEEIGSLDISANVR